MLAQEPRDINGKFETKSLEGLRGTMTSISSSFNGAHRSRINSSTSNHSRTEEIPHDNSEYTKEELERLRMEGEHLLRVGGQEVARERSNTSPMVYPGDSDNDDDISYSNSHRKKGADGKFEDSEDEDDVGNRGIRANGTDNMSESYGGGEIGPAMPPPNHGTSSGPGFSVKSDSSRKKKKKKKDNGKRHRSSSELSNHDGASHSSSSSSSEDDDDDAGISLQPDDATNVSNRFLCLTIAIFNLAIYNLAIY